MTLNFPSSPTNGQTYSLANGATYTWDGEKWKASNIPDSSTAVQTTDTPANGEFLKWDNGVAVWATDNDTIYPNFTGDSGSGGAAGLVPAPTAGDAAAGKYLDSDGTWSTPPDTDTTYSNATTSADGLMSSSDKSKLDGIATGATVGVPASGGNFTGTVDFDSNVTQEVQTVSALNIDCSTGNYFTKTISANSTFTVSNVPSSGMAYSFTLELTHTSGTVTWWSSLKWPGDTAPTLTAGKTHLFVFVTDDGGTRWRGASLVDYTN